MLLCSYFSELTTENILYRKVTGLPDVKVTENIEEAQFADGNLLKVIIFRQTNFLQKNSDNSGFLPFSSLSNRANSAYSCFHHFYRI